MSSPLVSNDDIAKAWADTPSGFSWPQGFARRIESLVRRRLAEKLRTCEKFGGHSENHAGACKISRETAANLVESD